MEFALVKYMSVELSKRTLIVQNFAEEIGKHFESENYGEDLKSLIIGIIGVSPQFEAFFKSRKPKYTKGKSNVESEGFKYKTEDCLEYDVKIDFGIFQKATDEEVKKNLAKEILLSLKVLDEMKSKIKDFNIEKFKADLESYFRKKELI